MGRKTKIDWADATWNPVTGCYHECEYCYARRITERFEGFDPDENPGTQKIIPEPAGKRALLELSNQQFKQTAAGDTIGAAYPMGFTPTLHRYLLEIPAHWTKPRTIFVCSMADLFGEWVPDEWIQEVFAACKAAPQHRYLFLTKNPHRLIEYAEKHPGEINCNGGNWWFGTTVNRGVDTSPVGRALDLANFYPYSNNCGGRFLSIEPILEPFTEAAIHNVTSFDWIIVGAETGNRKGKVEPKKYWIADIDASCKKHDVPVFMKESLRTIMGDDFRQEFPWEVNDNGM